MLTGRDAAHKRIADFFAKNQPLPEGVDFRNRFIYYVGPVDPVRDEVVGPAGPTTSTRMDKFTEMMLAQTGLIGMIGKAERGPVAIEAIRKHKAAYLMAVGGAAYLVSKAINRHAWSLSRTSAWRRSTSSKSRICRSPWRSTQKASVHQSGPAEWRAKIAKIPVSVA